MWPNVVSKWSKWHSWDSESLRRFRFALKQLGHRLFVTMTSGDSVSGLECNVKNKRGFARVSDNQSKSENSHSKNTQ